MTVDIGSDIGVEGLSAEQCAVLVHNGSTGRLAFLGADGRIELLTVRYAVDGGTIVCRVPAAAFSSPRGVPVTFEAFGENGGLHFSVVMKGRGRRITRETDVRLMDLLLYPAAEPDQIPIRVMADTMTGTQAVTANPLARIADNGNGSGSIRIVRPSTDISA